VIRRLLVAIGLLSVVVGAAMIVDPGLASYLSVESSAVLAVGALTLFQGFRVARARYATEIEAAETPDPETEQDLSVPGERFDDLLESVDPLRLRSIGAGRRRERGRNDPAERLENRLEAAAVSTIARKWGCSRDRAREALETGEWTDDRAAAAFFSGDHEPEGLREKLRYALSTELRGKQRAVRAADEIARLSASEDVDEEVIQS
jgi:hypothetical protein